MGHGQTVCLGVMLLIGNISDLFCFTIQRCVVAWCFFFISFSPLSFVYVYRNDFIAYLLCIYFEKVVECSSELVLFHLAPSSRPVSVLAVFFKWKQLFFLPILKGFRLWLVMSVCMSVHKWEWVSEWLCYSGMSGVLFNSRHALQLISLLATSQATFDLHIGCQCVCWHFDLVLF